MSHYGQVHTTLVIYPPDAEEGDLRLADLHRRSISVAVIGGSLLATALWSIGVAPLVAVLGSAALFAVAGMWIARRSRAVRRRAVSISTSASVLSTEGTQGQQQDALEALSDRMRHVARQHRRGECSRADFLDVWRDVYARVASGDMVSLDSGSSEEGDVALVNAAHAEFSPHS